MFRNAPEAEAAKWVSDTAMDITEVLAKLAMPKGTGNGMRVAYHAACSFAAWTADQNPA